MTCPAIHPEKDLQCERPAGNHPLHTAYVPTGHGPEPVDWPNTAYQPPSTPEQRSSVRKAKAQQIHAALTEHEISKLRPLARTEDVDTAQASAAQTKADIGPKLWEALLALDRPMSDAELLLRLRQVGAQITDRGPSKRRGDLRRLGLVYDTGQRVHNPLTHRDIVVWARTPAGQTLVQAESEHA